jgi:hypothetical protein
MSSFAVSCVWLLTMVVATVLAARPFERRRHLLELAAAYMVTCASLTLYVPPSGGVGFIAGLAAAWSLVSPGWRRLDRMLAGACAGAAAALYAACGLNRWLALLIGAGVVMSGVLLIPRRDTGTREFILSLAGVSAVAVGLAPDVAAGWRSARLLNHAVTGAHTMVPTWAVALLGTALVVGMWAGMRGRR